MLFNLHNNGSEELQQVLGTWAASSDYSIIKTEIEAATEELRNIVGSEIVLKAEKEYETEIAEHPLLNALRLPVACLAMMRQAKLSILSHDETGRKIKVNDNEKIPFEWMIDRDDLAMRERYYRALDSLYLYLEKNETTLWLSSVKNRRIKDSVIKDIYDFDSVYPLSGSYYTYYLLQHLVVEKQVEIAKYFGEFGTKVLSGSAPDELQNLAKRASVISALITACERWSLSIFPLEIARRFSPTYQGNNASNPAIMQEIDWYVEKLKKQLEGILKEAKSISGEKTNTNLLPENNPRNKFFTTV